MTDKIKILITGGCGFVGHHFVEYFLKKTDWEIIVFDSLTYAASGFDRLRDIECFDNERVKIFTVDLNKKISDGIKQEVGEVDYIINMASESHVDNSISDPVPFIQNNINLVLNMLEWARSLKYLKRFIHFSTDEVYGTAPASKNYEEGDRTNPGNPYAASKAAQESICRAYSNTYKLPIQITNTMNVIGERQHPEKFVPLVIRKVLNNETVKIHADSTLRKSGTRFYIHARNVADAVFFILQNCDKCLDNIDAGQGQFNIVGEFELSNLNLALSIADSLNLNLRFEMVDFHSSRPGHDLRYALDDSKLNRLGWFAPKGFYETLDKVVDWTVNNPKWFRRQHDSQS